MKSLLFAFGFIGFLSPLTMAQNGRSTPAAIDGFESLAPASSRRAKVEGWCNVQRRSNDPQGWAMLVEKIPFSLSAPQLKEIFAANGMLYDVGLITHSSGAGTSYLFSLAIRRAGTHPPDGMVAVTNLTLVPQPVPATGPLRALQVYTNNSVVLTCEIDKVQ